MSSINNSGNPKSSAVALPVAPAAGAPLASPVAAPPKDPAHADHQAVTHAVHQAEISFHVVEKAAHGLHEGAKVAAQDKQLLAVLNKTSQSLPGAMQTLARAAAKSGDSAETKKLVAAVPPQHQQAYTKALKDVARHHAAKSQAQALSQQQARLAHELNKVVANRGSSAQVARIRTLLGHVTKAANEAHARAREIEPEAKAAKAVLRAVHAELVDLSRRTARGVGFGSDAVQAWSKPGAPSKVMARLAEMQVATKVGSLLQHPVVKVGGKLLTGLAVGVDMWGAPRQDGTLAGNTDRVVGQTAVSAVLYTQMYTLPFVAMEAFMDKPHFTGVARVLPQLAGVMSDRRQGGTAAGERAAANLRAEIERGVYGASGKLGYLIADPIITGGLRQVAETTVAYWSNVSPAKAWKDAKEAWAWARQ